MDNKKIMLAGLFVGLAVLIVVLVLQSFDRPKIVFVPDGQTGISTSFSTEGTGELKQFSSFAEFKKFIQERTLTSNNYYGGLSLGMASRNVASEIAPNAGASASMADKSGSGVATDYSQTNIQVAGVDEPDIVKNDGKYIYSLSNNLISIVEAYPADSMRKVGEINLGSSSDSLHNMFVQGDKLIVFAQSYESSSYATDSLAQVRCLAIRGPCGGYSQSEYFTDAYVYDISDRASPVLLENFSVSGEYSEARMIGDYVYFVSQKQVSISLPEEDITPIYRVNGIEKSVPFNSVSYFDSNDDSFAFSLISSFSLKNGNFTTRVFLTGVSSSLYASQDNLYLASYSSKSYTGSLDAFQKDFVEKVFVPILPNDISEDMNNILKTNHSEREKWKELQTAFTTYSSSLQSDAQSNLMSNFSELAAKFEIDFKKNLEKTTIHKIALTNGSINYLGKGEVVGRTLNQFSMDEYLGNFRIATTTGSSWGSTSLNHLFILDSNLKQIGAVEDLAKGERIYSARFLGERAYMVTFRQVDPLYVIDLSKPSSPRVLGYLKIPGYSDYLHPYDALHIIGIGKDASAGGLYQGLKIALFDIADAENPVEVSHIIIGDRGSDSEVLQDHKALLFDKDKNLLVLPVSVAKINLSRYTPEQGYDSIPSWAYGDTIFRGAFVFQIDTSGINLRGRITHYQNESSFGDNYYSYSGRQLDIVRSLFMDNTLYTVSGGLIKANNLQSLQEISNVSLAKISSPIIPDRIIY